MATSPVKTEIFKYPRTNRFGTVYSDTPATGIKRNLITDDVGKLIIEEYKKDKVSRKDWEDAYIKGLDLLGTKYVNVTRPFKGASNVTHPMLSEATTQFQAQAYKELVPSDGPVRTQTVGLRTPAIEQQAERVKEYMNYLLMEEMEEFTTDMDQMLFYLPLSGSTFKKIY